MYSLYSFKGHLAGFYTYPVAIRNKNKFHQFGVSMVYTTEVSITDEPETRTSSFGRIDDQTH